MEEIGRFPRRINPYKNKKMTEHSAGERTGWSVHNFKTNWQRLKTAGNRFEAGWERASKNVEAFEKNITGIDYDPYKGVTRRKGRK